MNGNGNVSRGTAGETIRPEFPPVAMLEAELRRESRKRRCRRTLLSTSWSLLMVDAGGRVSANGEALKEPYVTNRSFGECDINLPCHTIHSIRN